MCCARRIEKNKAKFALENSWLRIKRSRYVSPEWREFSLFFLLFLSGIKCTPRVNAFINFFRHANQFVGLSIFISLASKKKESSGLRVNFAKARLSADASSPSFPSARKYFFNRSPFSFSTNKEGEINFPETRRKEE